MYFLDLISCFDFSATTFTNVGITREPGVKDSRNITVSGLHAYSLVEMALPALVSAANQKITRVDGEDGVCKWFGGGQDTHAAVTTPQSSLSASRCNGFDVTLLHLQLGIGQGVKDREGQASPKDL
ncbi:hypothetical protein AOLI_G00083820 [Acnodon oligacanthus]